LGTWEDFLYKWNLYCVSFERILPKPQFHISSFLKLLPLWLQAEVRIFHDFLDFLSGEVVGAASSVKETAQQRMSEQAQSSSKDFPTEIAQQAAESAMEVGDELAQSVKERSGKLAQDLKYDFVFDGD
jgi:hypothetical protein